MRTLYVSDLDGTLLSDRALLAPESREILARLIEEGLSFTYATARSQTSAVRCLNGLSVRLPVLTYNGGVLADPATGEVLEMEAFAPEALNALIPLLCGRGLFPLCYARIEGRLRVSHLTGRESPGVLEYLLARKDDSRLRPAAAEEALFAGEPFYFTCIEEKEPLLRAMNAIDALGLPVQRTLQLDRYQNRYWLEIMPQGTTKARGVNRLRRRLGFDRVVCFGDGINDLSLFEAADESYAVLNASDALKARADFVLRETNEQGAVPRALESLFSGHSPSAISISHSRS